MSELETVKPKYTFEQKVNQAKAIVEKEDVLNDEEEFDIITGKGIEYVLHAEDKPDIKLYIAPLKVSQYRMFYEIDNANREGRDPQEVLSITTAALAKIFKKDVAELEDYLDKEDIEKISTLLGCGVFMGRAMFSKKKLSLLQATKIISQGMNVKSRG